MDTADIICITRDPHQLVRLSQDLSNLGNLLLFEDINRAESKIQELNSEIILIIEIDPKYSFDFIEKYNAGLQWIGLCKEEDFPKLFEKMHSWKLENILPIPYPDDALRARVQKILNKDREVKSGGASEKVIELTQELEKTKEEYETQNSELQQLTSMLEENLMEAESVQEEIVPLMSALINLRIHEPLDVAIRPAKLAMRLAKSLNVDLKKRKDIYKAGLLHNIGMIAMPDDILNKPYNDLTNEQQEQFNELVLRGQAMLSSIPTFDDIALTIRHMYECYDGSGFPDRLTGKDIPLYSRILVPAIDYYELQKGIYFEKKHTSKEALVFILDHSGSRYDPKVVDCLSECLAEIDSNLSRVIEHIKLNKAVVGMELASSIRIKENMTLLRGGKILTESIMEKLLIVQEDIKQHIMLNVYRDDLDSHEQDAA